VILVLFAVFVATLAIFFVAYMLINRRTLADAELARARLRPVDAVDRAISLLKDDRVSDFGFLNRIMEGKAWVEQLQVQLERAGSSLKPGAFVLIVVACGVIGTLIGLRSASQITGIVLVVVGWAGPFVWLRWRQKKWLRALESQLPDAIEMLVSAMKAGYSFQAATQFLGEELVPPLGPAFARFYDEQRLGIDVRVALLSLQDRAKSLDLKMFVTAVLIQRETGGNLGEVLTNLADLIRKRITMKSHIQTLVAEPKLSAQFLAAIPVLVYLILSFLSPHFMDGMTHSGGGRLALILAATGVVVGYMIMMKIADVDV
jgi:tight adherence protein B